MVHLECRGAVENLRWATFNKVYLSKKKVLKRDSILDESWFWMPWLTTVSRLYLEPQKSE